MPPARSATAAPRRSPPLRIRWDRIGRIGLIVVLGVVAGLYLQRGLALLSVHNQAGAQRAIVLRLAKENAQLTKEAAALNNPAVIVRDARALGMVRPGERPYVITGLPSN